ncbi:MAG: lysophospholipid acyltransferase family protein [Flavobacteriales bacterium]|nr:lysophospholipid acyltransferase family protein [Flavobacteriales bacterium]
MLTILNIIQVIIILIWTATIGTIGIILLLITLSPQWVMLLSGKYLWSPVVLLISGVRVKVLGLENIDKKINCLYVSNHESHFDIVAIMRASPVPLFFIAKKELKKIPFMGWYMIAMGMIFIDRKNKESAMRSMKAAGEKIRKGKNVISFPEGTRTKTGAINLFRRGTFIIAEDGGIPILPLAVSGAREVLSRGKFRINPGTIQVNFGKVIQPHDFNNKTADELASHVRNVVVALKAKNMRPTNPG